MKLEGVHFTYATPRMMGIVKVVELTGFSQALEPQLLVEPVEEVVVVASRASMTRSGTAICIIVFILPTTCGARAAILTIFATPFSMLAEASNLAANSTSDGRGH